MAQKSTISGTSQCNNQEDYNIRNISV